MVGSTFILAPVIILEAIFIVFYPPRKGPLSLYMIQSSDVNLEGTQRCKPQVIRLTLTASGPVYHPKTVSDRENPTPVPRVLVTME